MRSRQKINMSNTLVFSGVSKKTLAIIAITVGVLFVALIGIRYAAAVTPADYGLTEGNTVSAAGSDDPDVYIVNEQGYKRLFLNPVIFGFYGHLGGFANVKSITPATRDAFPTSGLFRLDGDTKVYGVESTGEDTGVLHWVNTTGAQAVADDPNFFKKVFVINQNEFNWYTKGSNYTSVSQVPNYVRVPGTPATPGALAVSLAPGNPGAATVTTNAQGVEFLRVRLSGTGTVTGMTVKRLGAGSVDDFTNVYVYDGARRLVSGKSFSSSTGTATFIGLNVAVSGTKDLSIVADLPTTNATAGDVNYMQVTSVTLSSGTVSGLPVSGNYITVSGAASGTVTVTKTGSIGNPNVGQVNAHLSEFKVSANTEAASVKRIQMIQGGTVKPSDFANLKLKTGSNEWSGTINSSGEMVFDLGSGYTIAKGGNAIFDVYGDITGKKSETIALYFEYATDVLAIGDQYGYGMAAGITAVDSYTAGSSTESFELTLQGGVLTISFTGPTSADIGTSTDDTVFLKYTMTAATNIELRKTRLLIAIDEAGDGTWDDFVVAASTSIADIDDIKVVNEDNGQVLVGPVDGSAFNEVGPASSNPAGSDNAALNTFSDVIDLAAGQTIHVKVTGDVKTANTRTGSTLAADSKFAFLLEDYADNVGLTEMKYSGTNTALAAIDIVPNANIAGPTMTIKSSALSLGLASNPPDQTVVQGTQSIDAVGITFTATNASAMKVTDITLTGYSYSAATGTFLSGDPGDIGDMVSSVALYEKESGALISSSPTSNGLAAAAGTVVFNGLNWNIPAGGSKTLLVRANLLNLAPPTNYFFTFDIENTTDVTALDNSNNSVNAGNASVNGGVTVVAGSTVVTYTSAGSIYVTEYESSPSKTKHSIYWGQTGVTLAQFKVRTTNEGFYITKFNLFGVGANDRANIKNVYLSYLDKAGNTITSSAQSLNADTVPSVSFKTVYPAGYFKDYIG